jgi:hypothetical protein
MSGTTPQSRGRFPGYDVLAQADHWDDATRRLVLARVTEVPPIRFFSPAQERALRPFCDIVLAQDREPRVPVLEMVDAKLHAGKLDGFRYDDMPEDPETWRRVARHLDDSARERGAADFAALGAEAQHALVQDLADGKLEWDDLPPARAWEVVTRILVSEFYSHPWTWNEIGFGGPAYPRGYARLGAGQREQWEAPPAADPDPVREVREEGLE